VESVELYRDLVMGARDIYLSSISNNLNHIMKVLTIITVIALPMTIVTSFFGMNFDSDPNTGVPVWRWFLNHSAGLWTAMAIILLLVAALVAMFWKKGWVGGGERLVPQEREPRRLVRNKREAAADHDLRQAAIRNAAVDDTNGKGASAQPTEASSTIR
jgi:hypothetical protein